MESPVVSTPTDGTHDGLRRSLGTLSSIAIAFSAGGVSAGVYSLFGFSLGMAGPAFFWGWILVGLGTFFIVLVWAELASHYPLAGVMFEWPRRLAGERAGWWVGFLYLFGMMFQLAGIYFILPAVLLPLLDIEPTTSARLITALIALAVAAIANLSAIERVGKLTVIASALELIVIFGITLGTLIGGSHRSPAIVFQTNVADQGFAAWLPGFLGGGVFIGYWVMQSFEAGGTIGEETLDAPRRAPRAVLSGWAGSFIVGLFSIFSLLVSMPALTTVLDSSDPVLTIINSALSSWVGNVYLVLLAVVVMLGANVVFTVVTRQIFSMARADDLPGSRHLRKTLALTGEPWVAVVATALITAIPFIFSDQFAVLATGATALLYLVYFAMTGLTLIARFRGWPARPAPFSLGRWGVLANAIAVLYAGAALVDLLWPRPATNPDWHFGIPVAYWLLALPIVIGLVYRFSKPASRGRRLPGPADGVDDTATGFSALPTERG